MWLIKYLSKKALLRKFQTLEVRGEIRVDFPENLVIGDYCFVNSGNVWNCEGGLIIGTNVIFGQDVMIQSSNHDIEGNFIPYGDQMIKNKVIIENNVWIGSRVVILPGVTVGEGSVVGAGSVVTRDIEPHSICGGVPAKFIKSRNIKSYKERQKAGKLYQRMVWEKRRKKW